LEFLFDAFGCNHDLTGDLAAPFGWVSSGDNLLNQSEGKIIFGGSRNFVGRGKPDKPGTLVFWWFHLFPRGAGGGYPFRAVTYGKG